jgi:hypothetical protein
MSRKTVVGILIGAVALASCASIIASLRHALGRREKRAPEHDALEAERAKIQAALGDRVAPLDLSMWPERLRGRPELPDRDTLRNSITPIDRPAWVDVREDRDARGY